MCFLARLAHDTETNSTDAEIIVVDHNPAASAQLVIVGTIRKRSALWGSWGTSASSVCMAIGYKNADEIYNVYNLNCMPAQMQIMIFKVVKYLTKSENYKFKKLKYKHPHYLSSCNLFLLPLSFFNYSLMTLKKCTPQCKKIYYSLKNSEILNLGGR